MRYEITGIPSNNISVYLPKSNLLSNEGKVNTSKTETNNNNAQTKTGSFNINNTHFGTYSIVISTSLNSATTYSDVHILLQTDSSFTCTNDCQQDELALRPIPNQL